jgi:hypothetical protein
LACIDECAYCNEDQTVCGLQSAQALLDSETGRLRVGVGGVFEYVKGFKGTSLAIENINCVEENIVIVSCETCDVYVNGEKCKLCCGTRSLMVTIMMLTSCLPNHKLRLFL